jgi:hypothetical protein
MTNTRTHPDKDLINPVENFYNALENLVETPSEDTACIAHQASLRGYEALLLIMKKEGVIHEEEITHYKILNSLCIKALQRVPNNGNGNNAAYFATLAGRREELLKYLKIAYDPERDEAYNPPTTRNETSEEFQERKKKYIEATTFRIPERLLRISFQLESKTKEE